MRALASGGRGRWAGLVAGVLLLLVANGRWIVAPAAWLALPGWLVFVERSRPGRGLTTAFCMWLGVFLVAWRGIVPAPGWLYVAITGSYALVYFVPLVVHRLVATRLNSVAATLVFPFSWVGVEFVFQRWITPYGSWMSLAYSQTGQLALLQVAALAGTAGISFLVTWLAAALAVGLRPVRRADRVDRGGRRWSPLAVWAAVLAAVVGWGGVRLQRAPDDLAGVRTASIMPSAPLLDDLEGALAPLRRGGTLGQQLVGEVAAKAGALDEDLFRRTVREARAGARIVAWTETAGRVVARDETAFLERGADIAAAESVTLVLAFGVWRPGATPPFQNKIAAIGSDGSIAWRYEKSHPIVGPESPLIVPGEGRLRSLPTAAGKLSAVICHDLDFPELLRQAAAEQIGLVVGPSHDWALITDIHARMARLRAIEFGFSLLRPTLDGRTLAVDPWGRTRAAVDHAGDAVVAHVPVLHVGTVYGALGDWLGWLTIPGLVVMVVITARRTRSKSSS